MFYVLDGYALAYRHFFAYQARPLMTASGETTSAVFGFSKMLMDLLEKEKPFYLGVALDAGMSGRDELFPAYKGTREQMPDELERQIRRIEQIIEAFNIPKLTLPGYEADDVIGTIATQAEAEGLHTRIFSGDRDLLQLLTNNISVRLFVPMAKVPDIIYDVAAFKEKYGLEPHQLIDYKALVGDTSDNIPGVNGIGDKTATNLLQVYGTLDNIYENLALLAKGVQQKLTEGRDAAYLSQKLATVMCDAPIKLDKAKCIAHDFNKERVEDLFRELEFNSLFNQLGRLGVRTTGQLPLFGDVHDDFASELDETPPPAELIPTVVVDMYYTLDELVYVL
jgi:DNA polymerase-1